jgi:nitrous oxide reductase
MSRNQRVGLLVAAGVVVVVAIVIALSGGGGDSGTTSAGAVHRIDIKGGKPDGGVQNFKVKKGDRVTIVVSADAHDMIHLHGYDIEKDVEPGKPATFKFTANLEGIFDIESHVAEDAGREPQMGKLTVEPD